VAGTRQCAPPHFGPSPFFVAHAIVEDDALGEHDILAICARARLISVPIWQKGRGKIHEVTC